MLSFKKKNIKHLTSQFAQPGTVVSILIRGKRKEPPTIVDMARAMEGEGLKGDHYASSGGKRQVTLIAQEHIDAMSSMLGKEVDPLLLRRNIVTKGINLHALKDKEFKLGEAILMYTGECHPCSRMEENLGEGGYNAMRSHGGITARIIQSGLIKVGDELRPKRM